MRIWLISDTHQVHGQLIVPDNIDMVIHAGDATNIQNARMNLEELKNFISWYESLNIKHKIFIAGNHDTSIERNYFDKESFINHGITYLEHQTIIIEGIKIFGSPYTPAFGVGWAYNKDRSKLHELWQDIEPDTDIVVTHGPPRGVLDISYNRDNNLEMCGCVALAKRIKQIKPKRVVFGHIHNMGEIQNQGTREINGITYVNASVVEDGRIGQGPASHGIIIQI